ncbi:MAG: glycosyltransferase family 8 protein [Lactobacillus delbrueckii]|jgi:lipopolysaccharide biosynthesis glycosyltransferase|uniref:glycosyltransferase family 8 protein n=1 Tax=Lactobacillus TaxID=1578 RepID=UPI0003436CEE|nr:MULTISPECIES: glycosyltransferase family 8 protein [Lactobacillus]EPB98307.1 glycosyl transferase 8 family protein [Lactobacillus delbrueckii subsp. lactis CRL581]MCD5443058.1 glycosyltransferase family 8 protein [Lactobacillus delbrueckii subsp. lactis]MCD5561673.1 glycosyltransferase family 8 protein [Lactobacillus delbrueckii subsp. lactis]MCD5599003.1 glycosyltransferase family 8 protein [Lactobacillus delbrueckii subsp. lactis]OFS80797.1 glucosyltransferase [Lactobacillus sp. HMSC08B12
MTVPVFYSITDDFTPYAAVSLHSLVKHADPKRDYTVTFLHQGLSRDHEKALAAYNRDNVHIKFYEMSDELLKPIQDRKENYFRGDFAMSIFYRLFIPDLFPEYDKVVYIDSDTVLNDDIAKLYDHDLGNNLLGACTDTSIQFVEKILRYIKEVLALDPKEYINSGMLVMNAKAFREENFVDKFFSLLGRYHFDCIAPDQDYLNEICSGRIKYLDGRWDAMPNENTAALENPGLIHYNLFSKPWRFSGIQYEDYFWTNAEETIFADELKAELAKTTDEERDTEYHKLDRELDMTLQDPHNWARVKENEQVTL